MTLQKMNRVQRTVRVPFRIHNPRKTRKLHRKLTPGKRRRLRRISRRIRRLTTAAPRGYLLPANRVPAITQPLPTRLTILTSSRLLPVVGLSRLKAGSREGTSKFNSTKSTQPQPGRRPITTTKKRLPTPIIQVDISTKKQLQQKGATARKSVVDQPRVKLTGPAAQLGN